MRSLALASLLAAGGAAADTAPPAGGRCAAPPPAVRAEVERLLRTAGGHATRSDTCVDGDGEVVTVELLGACVIAPPRRPNVDAVGLALTVRYRVTITYERGGECSPYPRCAEPPPPTVRDAAASLTFRGGPDGLRLAVPAELPGVKLLTPLDRPHRTGCRGDRPAFVPAPVSAARG